MMSAEITESETRERGRILWVDSYDISLDLNRGDKIFGSTSVIRFDCAEPGARVHADLIAKQVHEITLNGVAVDPAAACQDGRIAMSSLAASNELRVVADCAYTASSSGLHRAVDSADGSVYHYTNFEPGDARRVFANFEQPDLKASFSFHISAPAHWTVLSNQPTPEPVSCASGMPAAAVWHFPPTPRISTYLTAVAAGEYHLVRDSHTTPGGQVIPLGIACRASLARYLDYEDILTITRQGLDYYSRLFGTDYPFAKYDQVFVPEFRAGAMENVGCVIFGEPLVFRSRVSDAMYELRATVILHEMAHMWFGDLVTMRWWDDLWLNESFAEFCATLSASEATRFTQAWSTFSAGRKSWGYMQDRQPSTHPIAADVPTLSEAVANFDGISYAKGAAVLKQLAAYVGRENFFAGIRAYLAKHSWGNATLADLLQALEAASGLSLADWSKEWLEKAGPNVLRASFEIESDGSLGSFAVLQEAMQEQPTLRSHHIAIGLYNRVGMDRAGGSSGVDAGSGVLERTHRMEVDITGACTAVPDLDGLAQPDLIVLNDDDLGYAITRFDPRSLATLATSISDIEDALTRAVCWSAVIDMVRQAELSVQVFITMLVNAIATERSESILQMLHSVASMVMAQLADPQWIPTGNEQLATTAMMLLHAAVPGSSHQLTCAQLLGRTAITTGQLDFLAALLDRSASVPGLVVDTELRWNLLRRLAATGRAGDTEIDSELDQDATDAGRRHAAACRAAMPDAAHKAAAWALLTKSDDLGMETLREVSQAFLLPEHAHLLSSYVDKYFEALPEIWSSREEGARRLLGQMLFPFPVASPELLAKIDAFSAAAPDDYGLRRVMTENRDIVERALLARELRE